MGSWGGERPKAGGVVFACRGEVATGGVDGEGEDGVGVAAEDVEIAEGGGVDDADFGGVGGHGECGVRGRNEGKGQNLIIVCRNVLENR